jgi:hypothetical protein
MDPEIPVAAAVTIGLVKRVCLRCRAIAKLERNLGAKLPTAPLQ